MSKTVKTKREEPSCTLSDVIPLYYQLAEELKTELLLGQFTPGMQYYSNRDLVRKHGISILTVRRALDILVKEQLLEQAHGKGTFVAGRIEAIRQERRKKDIPQNALLFSGWDLEAMGVWDAMYFRDIFIGVKREADRRGFRLIYDRDLPTGPDLARRATELGVRGAVVLIGSDVETRALTFKKTGIPVVTINFSLKHIPSVAPDDREGARRATRYLLESGHARVAHINSGEMTQHWTAVADGYRDVLTEKNLTLSDHPVVTGHTKSGSVEAGRHAMLLALKRSPRPTGIFAGNDLMAIGALKALQEKKISVPDEISVIGFDNIAACELCTPALSTVAVNRDELGRAAVQCLLDTDTRNEVRMSLTPELKIRESSASAKHVQTV